MNEDQRSTEEREDVLCYTSDVLEEDRLFATLDTTSRKLWLGEGREIIVSDTVGFIRDLPKDLVDAFRSTLEDLCDASLLIHLIDVTDEHFEARIASVEKILEEAYFRCPQMF